MVRSKNNMFPVRFVAILSSHLFCQCLVVPLTDVMLLTFGLLSVPSRGAPSDLRGGEWAVICAGFL